MDGYICYSETMADILGIEGIIQVMKDKGYTDYETLVASTAKVYATTVLINLFEYHFFDAHLVENIRTNVMYQMQKEIIDYYDIKEGDVMYLAPEDRVVIFGSAE